MGRDDREVDQGDDGSELKVTDRRLFTADGRLRDELGTETGTESEVEKDAGPEPEPEPEPTAAPAAGFEHRPVEEPEGVDFGMLVNSMAELALLFLGELRHPGSGDATVDLPRARIQIDMLELLRVKCRGNLSREEEGLLDRVLYELRMRYVARSQSPPSPS